MPFALPRIRLRTVLLLEKSVGDVLPRAYGPFNDFHAAEPAGVVALLAALEGVELGVGATP